MRPDQHKKKQSALYQKKQQAKGQPTANQSKGKPEKQAAKVSAATASKARNDLPAEANATTSTQQHTPVRCLGLGHEMPSVLCPLDNTYCITWYTSCYVVDFDNETLFR